MGGMELYLHGYQGLGFGAGTVTMSAARTVTVNAKTLTVPGRFRYRSHALDVTKRGMAPWR